ncbi:hypothetical protein F5887DRAFT_1284186 [Amanita rubescens]|nr:hypothetical protein F5887DRAFT_1284186 [Amanita rubescens]
MPFLRVISTLCPKRLKPSDCIDLSGILTPAVTLPCGRTRLRGLNHDYKVPFPPNTRGFLYYHIPPKAPPFVGEIRFRCANSLQDFPNGKDLLSIDRFNPWSITLSTLSNQTTYLNFQRQLMLDDLASQTTVDTWVTKKALYKSHYIGPKNPILYYFRQPFLFRFDSRRLAFYTATKDQIGLCITNNPTSDHRRRRRVQPYGGISLVQMERYASPQRPKDEMVALRILEIVEPVKILIEDYDGHIQRPTEGALIQQSKHIPITILKTAMEGAGILPHNFEDLP